VGRVSEFGSPRHLVTRFLTALWPGGPGAADEAWARRFLLPGEADLWRKMSGPDRRHAIGVARTTISLLGEEGCESSREVVAGALLHDVGKIESGLGTVGRAVLTSLCLAVGRRRFTAAPAEGVSEAAWRRRARLYLTHDQLGAGLLERAGSHPLTVAWAAEHHRDPEHWTVDPRVGAALKAADDD